MVLMDAGLFRTYRSLGTVVTRNDRGGWSGITFVSTLFRDQRLG
jgi:hypothetical protein